LHDYQKPFLAQFAKVVTCQREIRHPNPHYRHQAQPWLAGIQRQVSEDRSREFVPKLSHEDFARMRFPEKTRRLSVICSNKVMIPGHQARLDFVDLLRKADGKQIEVFSTDLSRWTDKWDILPSCHYHLVLENSCVRDYWSEKLADAFLAWCVPIVWGCPNLKDYFPEQSFVDLDPNDMAASVERVKETIAREPSEEQRAAVSEARRLVLEEYNLFSEIQRLIEAAPAEEPRRTRLKDERLFLPGASLRPLVRAVTDPWRIRK
jgi:hypothetical protein